MPIGSHSIMHGLNQFVWEYDYAGEVMVLGVQGWQQPQLFSAAKVTQTG